MLTYILCAGVALAWLLIAIVLGLFIASRIPKLRDDARTYPPHAFRILPAEPQHAGGGGSPTGPRRPANSVRSSSHNPGDIR